MGFWPVAEAIGVCYWNSGIKGGGFLPRNQAQNESAIIEELSNREKKGILWVKRASWDLSLTIYGIYTVRTAYNVLRSQQVNTQQG